VAWWIWLLVVWPAAAVLVGIVLGKMISRAEASDDQHRLEETGLEETGLEETGLGETGLEETGLEETGRARTETSLSLSRTLRRIPGRKPRRRGKLLDGA
jgi:hypothetical protein